MRSFRRHRRSLASLALLSASGTAQAVLEFDPYATAAYLHESNVYQFSRQVADVTGTTETADSSQRYVAGLGTHYSWSRQALRAVVEGRYIDFADFEHLDHEEHAIDAGYRGGWLGHTQALLNFRDERRMGSFEDRRSTEFVMERDRVGDAGLDVTVTPRWHAVAAVRSRRLHSPLPAAPALPQPPPGATARNAAPDFTLYQNTYQAGVQYGVESREHPELEAPLLGGVQLEYQTTHFGGVTPQPPPEPGQNAESFGAYSLLTLAATAQYAFDGLSSLDAELGATLYDPDDSNSDSRPELTGEVGYLRKFSAVTRATARLFRRIVQTGATGSAATDTGASVGAEWGPRVNLLVAGEVSYARSAFESGGRDDSVLRNSLSIAYALVGPWGLRLFGSRADRKSNLSYYEYSDEIVGFEATYRWSAR